MLFGQVIVIRVLECSIFETSCANRSLHNEHGNVICAKRSFVEKEVITKFCQKITFGTTKKVILKSFFQFENFWCILSQSTNYCIN